ncbi:MAG: GNVR domain-containing protein [Anaerolineae bacterium]|nr:Wzz/FepE/Etk N-terminal domain-containing protein [Anaerolineae bacterium]MDW8100894.1 GNVR domain-containing protein [Anaerolineae bacterium]
MEEEIDLREYIFTLLKYWKWILGTAIATAVVALGVSFLLSPTYEAIALVAVTKPRYIMQFDPRIAPMESVSGAMIQPAYKAYPELATSDEVLQELLSRLNPRPENLETLEDLSGITNAKSGTDPSVIRLIVRYRDPDAAAHIANLWAEIFIRRANEIYGTEARSQLQFYQQQLERARTELTVAEEMLVEFQARNRESILQNQLSSYRQMQADYLADQRQIAYIVQDIQGLREQLSRQPTDQPSTLADQLTALFLQIKAFNAQASAPIQLQVDNAATLSEKSLPEQIAFLDDMVQILEKKSAEIEGRLAELEPQILALQQELQQIYTEADRLTRARDVARETYMTLTRKVEEARIAAEDASTGEVRLASQAAVPERPVSPRKLLNTAIAGMLGLMVAVFGAFGAEWWRNGAGEQGHQGAWERRSGDVEA